MFFTLDYELFSSVISKFRQMDDKFNVSFGVSNNQLDLSENNRL